jgi:hypothetical protein
VPAASQSAGQAPAEAPKTHLEALQWLRQRWRKYGVWDYKQTGSEYRDYTQFNFGATGGAAGLDKNSLLALAKESKPTPADVDRLDNPELLKSFDSTREALDKLRAMTQLDNRVVRIANDYTWLDTDTKWPRDDIGFTIDRWNEYRKLFDKLSLQEGIVRNHDFPGAVFLIASSTGLCTGGSSNGYVYSQSPLAPTTESPKESLDKEARNNPSKHFAYVFRPLKENWYAFYEVDW